MRWFDISSSDLIGTVSLSLEINCLFIPVADGSGDGVHGHDMTHEGGGNSGGIVSNENIFIINVGHGHIVLKKGGVLGEGWGVLGEGWGVLVSPSILSRFLDHSFGGEPGDGISFYVMMFKCGLKLVTNTVKVPMTIVELTRAFCLKLVAQMRAGPLVIYERVKVIFFVLVLYTSLFTVR